MSSTRPAPNAAAPSKPGTISAMQRQKSGSTIVSSGCGKSKLTTDWFCHCCIARNDDSDTACRVCNRPRSYANAPHLPLHDNGKYILRPDQVGALLPGHRIHDCNARKWTALHSCAAVGNVQLVEELVNQGSEIEATTVEGYTPLHLAVHSGSIEAVSALVVRKANVNAQTFFEKNTPLHVAVKEGWRRLVQYLIDIGADIHIVNAVGRSPLHVAASTGRVDIGTLLLQNNAKFQQMDFQGWTPQQIAEYHNHFDFQEILMRSGLKDSQYKITDIVKGNWDTELWGQVVRGRRQREEDLANADVAYDVASVKTGLALAASQSLHTGSASWSHSSKGISPHLQRQIDNRPSRDGGQLLLRGGTGGAYNGVIKPPRTDPPTVKPSALPLLAATDLSASPFPSKSATPTRRSGKPQRCDPETPDNVSIISELSKDGSECESKQQSKHAAAARRNMLSS